MSGKRWLSEKLVWGYWVVQTSQCNHNPIYWVLSNNTPPTGSTATALDYRCIRGDMFAEKRLMAQKWLAEECLARVSGEMLAEKWLAEKCRSGMTTSQLVAKYTTTANLAGDLVLPKVVKSSQSRDMLAQKW